MTVFKRHPEVATPTKEKIEYFLKCKWSVHDIAGLYATTDKMINKIKKGDEVILPIMSEPQPKEKKVYKKNIIVVVTPKVRLSRYSYVKRPTGNSIEGNREKILARDNNTCQVCGRIWKGEGKRMDISPLIQGEELERDSDISKFITNCHQCVMNRRYQWKKVIHNPNEVVLDTM